LILILFSFLGEEPCEVQLHVKRHLEHVVSVGKPFRMECPVKYCASRPNVTWCKLNGTECLDLGDRHHLHTSWEERKSISIFILHFEPVFPSDNGSYRCSAQFTSHVVTSHSIIIHVIGEFSTPRSHSGFLIVREEPDSHM
jgi:B- and T-lymphocyte attenuator